MVKYFLTILEKSELTISFFFLSDVFKIAFGQQRLNLVVNSEGYPLFWRILKYEERRNMKKNIEITIYISDRDLSRSHELSKVHKDDYPLRMIVSCINSPLFNLFTFLKNIIDKSNKKNFSYIKTNSISSKKLMVCLYKKIIKLYHSTSLRCIRTFLTI